MEVLIAAIIVVSAVYIFVKSIKKKGCGSECSCCGHSSTCCSKNK